MLIKLKGTNKEEHVSQTVASVLIAMGAAVEVKPTSTPTDKPTVWGVTGMLSDYPPMVTWKCPNCGQSGQQESERGTADRTAEFRHCKKVEKCPEDVSRNYGKAWEAFASKHNRRAANTPRPEDIKRFVYKTVG
jgi:hypothetical protein